MEVTPQKQTNMKKLILSIAVILLTLNVNAQDAGIRTDKLEVVGEARTFGTTFASLYKYKDGTYTLNYKDNKYTALRVYKDLHMSQQALDLFKEQIAKLIKSKTGTEVDLNIGNSIVSLKRQAFKTIRISQVDGAGITSFTYLSKKQLSTVLKTKL